MSSETATQLSFTRGAATPPPVAGDTRRELAAELLRGSGIEIGALHLPIALPPGVSVRYVDRMTVPELRAHYSELESHDLVPVDVVDDGELLSSFEPESVDFIVANHFLEHCEDPIRTIETHLGKLRPGGVLFYAVPDKRYTFDFRRPRTPLSHVIADYEDGGRASRHHHYLEWLRFVYPEDDGPPDEQTAHEHAAVLEATGYSIHFHVWTQADLLELMLHCQTRLEWFDIDAVRRVGVENIVVLRKHGELVVKESPAAVVSEPESVAVAPKPVDPKRRRGLRARPGLKPMTRSVLRAAAGRLSRASKGPALAVAGRVPLSALRSRLDEKSAGTGWLLHSGGVLGRTLLLPAGTTYTVPLKLSGEALFSGRVMLLPHDWRDGHGTIRASVAVTDAGGHERTLWSGRLRASDWSRPRGRLVECRVPAFSTSLRLSVGTLGAPRYKPVQRAIWLEPAITDTHAPPLTRPSSDSRPAERPPARPGAPLISVLTPVHDPPLHLLEETIASVRQQTFTDWELCVVDDGSTDPEVIAVLRRHAASDSRIHLNRRETAGGISTATNAALDLATGEYIALLDHDDMLTPDALQRVATEIASQPGLDMIYSDEDVVGDPGLIEHHPKPGWSPEHMSALMYTCHLGIYRRTLALEVGGFRSQFDGCQDYDFVLRLMERTDRVAHIPQILYHWRAHNMSTAGGDAKPYAYLAQPGAIADHLERSGVEAEVQFTHVPGVHRIVHRVGPSTIVDLVLPIGDPRGLSEAAASWLSQAHPGWGVAVAGPPESIEAATAALISSGVVDSRIATAPTAPGTDRATALVAAADASRAEHLILMDALATGLTHDWLTRLIGYSSQPQIAAAGPVVLARDGRIQHAGIAIPDGIPLYIQHGSPATSAPLAVFNLSALSGVLATRRTTYRELGGLDPQFQEFALVEYCLRATEAGRRVVIVPDARMRATGPDLTTNDLAAIWRLRERWGQSHTDDPYYNPRYRTDRGDFVLADYG